MRRQFDEFKDREYADWKRIRSALEHENTLVNHRVTWLLTSQAFLIAALVAVFNEAQKPEGLDEQQAWLFSLTIAAVSFTICLAIGRSLAEASYQLDHLDNLITLINGGTENGIPIKIGKAGKIERLQ
jgi:hypothetical protein